jgi:hypothetical protein
VDRAHPVADDGQVRWHAHEDLHVDPARVVAALAVVLVLDAAVQRHDAGVVRPLDQPRIVVCHPVIGPLALPAPFDDLLEQPELVVDAVAMCRVAVRRERIEKAGGESPQPAVAHRRLRFVCLHILERQPELGKRRAPGVEGPHVRERAAEDTSEQVLD